MKYLVPAPPALGAHVVAALEQATRWYFARSTGGDVLDAASVRAAADRCGGAFHCAGKVSRRTARTQRSFTACTSRGRARCSPHAGPPAYRRAGAGLDQRHGCRERSARGSRGHRERPGAHRDHRRAGRTIGRSCSPGRFALERPGPLEVVSVNPSLLLGPGDVNGSSTEDVRLFLEGSIPAVPAGGLSFVDARDAADAMLRAMDRGRAGERYLVGACNLTFREFFARLGRVSGQSVRGRCRCRSLAASRRRWGRSCMRSHRVARRVSARRSTRCRSRWGSASGTSSPPRRSASSGGERGTRM